MTGKELEALKNVDVRKIDRGELMDIQEVEIDQNLPVKERIIAFIEQVKNPYCFKVGDVMVKVTFAQNGPSFEDQFEKMLTRIH